jgi:hypothetical protein
MIDDQDWSDSVVFVMIRHGDVFVCADCSRMRLSRQRRGSSSNRPSRRRSAFLVLLMRSSCATADPHMHSQRHWCCSPRMRAVCAPLGDERAFYASLTVHSCSLSALARALEAGQTGQWSVTVETRSFWRVVNESMSVCRVGRSVRGSLSHSNCKSACQSASRPGSH